MNSAQQSQEYFEDINISDDNKSVKDPEEDRDQLEDLYENINLNDDNKMEYPKFQDSMIKPENQLQIELLCQIENSKPQNNSSNQNHVPFQQQQLIVPENKQKPLPIYQQDPLQFEFQEKMQKQDQQYQDENYQYEEFKDLQEPQFQKNQQSNIEDYLMCPNCQKKLKIEELEQHDNVCENQQAFCDYCKEQYPKMFILEHMQVCDAKKQQEQAKKPKHVFKEDQNVSNVHFDFKVKPKSEKELKRIQQKINQILDQGGDISQLNLQDHDMTDVGGLKKKQLERLAKITFQGGQDLDQESMICMVCQSEYIIPEVQLLLPCTHRFHQDCIENWLVKNPKCPLCMKDVGEYL